MKIYLVGGAVRDRLLGLEVRDRDWVVVGGSEEEMLALGYRRADADFPVFIHPHSGEEYALARRETKSGPGYKGFIVDAGPEVTLQQDLQRRDLTVNAIAEDTEGVLTDPFDGQQDLQQGLLRHVSPAFVEDPVRLLRIARFAARLGKWGFRVAHPTHRLLQQMAAADDLASLRPERLWQEMRKALAEQQPWRFFQVLERCGALPRLIPELAGQGGAGHGKAAVAEGFTALQRAAAISDDPQVRFAVLFHAAAEAAGAAQPLCQRLRVEREYADLLGLLLRWGRACRDAAGSSAEALLALLQGSRAIQRPARFTQLLDCCDALWPEAQRRPLLQQALQQLAAIDAGQLRQQGFSGAALGNQLTGLRLASLRQLLQER